MSLNLNSLLMDGLVYKLVGLTLEGGSKVFLQPRHLRRVAGLTEYNSPSKSSVGLGDGEVSMIVVDM